MIAIWPDNKKPTEFYYECSQSEGELIYKVFGRIGLKDLKHMGLTEDEITQFYKIYNSF